MAVEAVGMRGGPSRVAVRTISDYLIERLHAHGVEHAFGVPGDYVITLYDQMLASGLVTPVNTCDEQGAGFAADAYARLRGMGVVCGVYGVGGFKFLNTTAQAWAEKSPVVVITGAPGVRERTRGPVNHHLLQDFYTELRVFREVTVASTVLEEPATAFAEIDRVLAAAVRYRRPVYIQIPRDMFLAPGDADHVTSDPTAVLSRPEALADAVAAARDAIDAAERPVFWAGEELQRYGLAGTFRGLVEETGIPFASSVLGKAMLSELHPRSMGVYNGKLAPPDVREYVEASDCLVTLGVMRTDLNYGFFTADVRPEASVYVTADRVVISGREYVGVGIADFVNALASAPPSSRQPDPIPRPARASDRSRFQPVPGAVLSSRRVFEAIDAFVEEGMVVTTDNGETSWAGVDLTVPSDAGFFSPGYYASVGFSLPFAMGIQFADRTRRPLALVGDAAFQMTGVELSTIARFGLNPIVVVMNNGGYGTERPLFDRSFDDIARWDYASLPAVLGAGKGFSARTEDELVAALAGAREHADSFSLVDVHLAVGDYSEAFTRFINLFAVGAK